MSRYVYLNGAYVPFFQAQVSVNDRGLLFGDAVYEVIHFKQNYFVDGPDHLQRLDASLNALSIHLPYPSHQVLMVTIRHLKRLNRVHEGFVYIHISRGVAPRNHLFPKNPLPSFFMFVQHKQMAPLVGQKIRTDVDGRWHRCDIKTTNLLHNVLAKQKAHEMGLFDTWGVSDDGYITEGALSNAWIVKDGTLYTCPLTENILPGITRKRIIVLARKLNIPIQEERFTKHNLLHADEAFSSSSNGAVVPVVEVDGVPLGGGVPGPITTVLYNAYLNFIEEGIKQNA